MHLALVQEVPKVTEQIVLTTLWYTLVRGNENANFLFSFSPFNLFFIALGSICRLVKLSICRPCMRFPVWLSGSEFVHCKVHTDVSIGLFLFSLFLTLSLLFDVCLLQLPRHKHTNAQTLGQCSVKVKQKNAKLLFVSTFQYYDFSVFNCLF